MGQRSAILALVAAFLTGTAAQAVTTAVSAVLTQEYHPGARETAYNTAYLTPSFPFDPGDTIDVTLTFPGATSRDLGFLPGSAIFTVFGGGGSTSTVYQSTGTFSFINPVGAVSPLTGPQTGTSDRNPAITFTGLRQQQRGPLVFDGIHVIIDLDSALLPFSADPLPPGRFTAFQVLFTNDVPEPAIWAMLLVGFGLSGAAMRRRQATEARGLLDCYAIDCNSILTCSNRLMTRLSGISGESDSCGASRCAQVGFELSISELSRSQLPKTSRAVLRQRPYQIAVGHRRLPAFRRRTK